MGINTYLSTFTTQSGQEYQCDNRIYDHKNVSVKTKYGNQEAKFPGKSISCFIHTGFRLAACGTQPV